MTNLTKLFGAITSLSAVGIASAYASGVFDTKKDNIKPISTKAKDKLIGEGFDLNIDSTGWGKILTEYNKDKDISKTFKNRKEDNETEDGLSRKCEAFWNQNEISEINYKKLKQWCVKEETIGAILIRAKYKKLDTDSTNNDEIKKWESKVEKLKLNKASFPTIGEKMNEQKESNITALKEGCKALNIETLKTTHDEFNQKFENARDWCFLKENVQSITI